MTTDAPRRTVAVLDPRSERFGSWMQVLGADHVEVESPEPELADFGDGTNQLIFRARMDSLRPRQLERMYATLEVVWDLPRTAVRALLETGEAITFAAADVHLCGSAEEGRAHFESLGRTPIGTIPSAFAQAHGGRVRLHAFGPVGPTRLDLTPEDARILAAQLEEIAGDLEAGPDPGKEAGRA